MQLSQAKNQPYKPIRIINPKWISRDDLYRKNNSPTDQATDISGLEAYQATSQENQEEYQYAQNHGSTIQSIPQKLRTSYCLHLSILFCERTYAISFPVKHILSAYYPYQSANQNVVSSYSSSLTEARTWTQPTILPPMLQPDFCQTKLYQFSFMALSNYPSNLHPWYLPSHYCEWKSSRRNYGWKRREKFKPSISNLDDQGWASNFVVYWNCGKRRP